MANLTLIHNAFDVNDKSIIRLNENELYTPLYNVIPKYIKDSKDFDFVFSVNGIITENLNVMLKKDDHLAVVPIPAGGGGGSKNILSTIAMVALVVVAPQIGFAAQAALSGAYGAAIGATGYMAAYYGAYAGAMIAGGLLINSIMPVQTASYSSTSDLESVSPTYSFTAASNASAEGTAIPIVLGRASITPPIISSYISLDNDSQYLNILYALNDGKFDNIESITINDQDISNYEDIYYYRRLGTNDQDVIQNFSDNITTNSDGRALNDTETEVIYSTDSNAVNEIQLGFLMPKGLYYIKDDGAYTSRTITATIQYRVEGSSTWINAPTQISISATYKTAKRIVFTIPGLDEGEYEVKIQRTSAYDTNTRVANDLQLEYVNEITYDDLTYPNVGLLSLNALATDQLSGGYPTVKILVNNTYVRYWEDDVLVEDTNKRLDNPAWATYYILRKADFTDDNIDVAMFQEWADYCDTKNYTCNLVLDQKMELPDILNMITPLGRAKIIQKGTKWSVVIDRIVDAPTQSFLFTSGNIVENSFSLDYVPYTDRANVIEVTYYDEDNNYEATTVQAQSPNYDITDDEYKTSITYYGCTNKQMAADYAQFLINNNRYITETVSFTAAIESLACNVGDVIKVGKKYLTNNEADGRIVSDTNGTLVLDNLVFFEAEKTYSIEIRKASDDTLHTFLLVNPGIETNQVALHNPTTTFSEFDIYSVGETGYQTNLYRVVNISRSNDFERKISAIEYIPEVYDDTLTIPDEEVITPLSVRDLKTDEVLVKNEDGSISEYLNISWQNGFEFTQDVVINGKVVGTSSTNEFLWDNPTRENTYTVKIGGQTLTHYYEGISTAPDAIESLSGSESGNVFSLNWSYTPPIDFKEYHIYVNGSYYGSTTSKYYVTKKIYGLDNKTFTVYAVDVLGNLSDAVSINLQAVKPSDVTVVDFSTNLEKIILSWEYEKPYDFDKFAISVAGKTFFTQDTYFEYPFTSDKTIFTISVIDTGNNQSAGQSYQYDKEYLSDITGLTSYFEGNILAYTWDKNDNVNIKYQIKKGLTWDIGAVVDESAENVFYPQSTGEYAIKQYYNNAYGVEFESENIQSFAVEGDLALKTNVVEVFDERDDGWNGTKTNTIIVDHPDANYDGALSTASSLLVDEIDNFDNIPDLDAYSTVPYGIYEADNILTLASSQAVKIIVDTAFLAKDVENLIDYWASFDTVDGLDGNISKLFKINRQIAISTDGSTYSDWRNFKNGIYIGKSFKFRVEFYSYDDSVIPYLQEFVITADMEDRIDRGTVTTGTSGYVTQSHSPAFNAVPNTVITIVDGQDGDNLVLTNETVNGFDVKVRNSGSDVVRVVNYVSQGY